MPDRRSNDRRSAHQANLHRLGGMARVAYRYHGDHWRRRPDCCGPTAARGVTVAAAEMAGRSKHRIGLAFLAAKKVWRRRRGRSGPEGVVAKALAKPIKWTGFAPSSPAALLARRSSTT